MRMTYEQEQKMTADAVARFPARFGLRAFPGKTFRVSPGSSFVSEGVVQIVVQTLTTEEERKKYGLAEWADFGRDAVETTLREVTNV